MQNTRSEGCKRLEHDVGRGTQVTITVDGEPVNAYEGESIAAALMASGRRTFRQTRRTGAPRGLFCGMGVCYDCTVHLSGTGLVRSCVTPVEPGMTVSCRLVDDGNN
jgi:predicted molibdopterin-dependent oxidoreductase YjgC